MRTARWICVPCVLGIACATAPGKARGGQPADAPAGSALTIYNQDFAVVRDTVELKLVRGPNEVRFSDTSAHVEPDSVILRDPAGKHEFTILEQNYRNDPVSQELLLSLYEGKTIEFLVQRGDVSEVVKGRIIRSGYVPHWQAMQRYGGGYQQSQMAYAQGSRQPVIEVDGKLRFSLPGQPLFPALADDTVLKPTLHWIIETQDEARFDAELAYVTGGMSWSADYNVVAPETGDVVDVTGWVTMDNQTGKTFTNARIKLMAGDVSKVQPDDKRRGRRDEFAFAASGSAVPAVTEKTFDEYHLYALERRTTLRDREQKQVEFVRAPGVRSGTVYVYDGAHIDWNRYRGYQIENIRQDRAYGTQSNPKVWVMREFRNSKDNGLGIPLPQGRLRFYRRDADGQLEFTGENTIDHTPKDETVRVYTGNAFDLVGERRQTDFKVDYNASWLDESFEIKLRNHKERATVEIRVVEHLYRAVNWQVAQESQGHHKIDSRTIEFRVKVPPDGEVVTTYKVHYTW